MSKVVRNGLAVVRVLVARMRFVAVFVVVGLVAAYWGDVVNHYDRWTRPGRAPDALAGAGSSDVEYYSVMHPWIVRSEPGNCPVCGMPLVKRRKGESPRLPKDVLARVQLTPERLALTGVETFTVEPRALAREVNALGVLDYDEEKVAHLSARVAGRADELFITYTGQRVKKGDPVYSLYSPEVYTAMREYLLARKRVNELAGDASTDLRNDATAVYNASMQKLILWGVSHEQLEQLEREYDRSGVVPTHLVVTSPIGGTVTGKEIHEGHYVQVGEDPYTVTDLTTLWLQAKVYERDIPLLGVGQTAEITVDAYPNETFAGTITYLDFAIDPETRTMSARLAVPNADLRLKPGMYATATIRVPLGAGGEVVRAVATEPAAVAATAPVAEPSREVLAAIEKYGAAANALAADRTEGVWADLKSAAAMVGDVKAPGARKLGEVVGGAAPADIAGLRAKFDAFSTALIETAKAVGLPAGALGVQVYHCPMADGAGDWLQFGGKTNNPYMGKAMATCGSAVESLPVARRVARAAVAAGATRPAAGTTRPVAEVLAIPRDAVIATGERDIVYVRSGEGTFDMRAVRIGPAAGGFYPVVSGLTAGEQVVTRAAFLLDAENRLNPPASTRPSRTVAVNH